MNGDANPSEASKRDSSRYADLGATHRRGDGYSGLATSLVLAETGAVHGQASQRILNVARAAIAAKVVASLEVDFVADLRIFGVVETFENVLNFLEMVALVFGLISRGI